MFTDILLPVLMLAGITFIAVAGRFLIRYAGKKYGIDTKGLEESLEQGQGKSVGKN